MFKRSDLEELAAYKSEHPVVSLYLHLDPRHRGSLDAYRARLKGLLKEAAQKAPQEDIAAIENYFDRDFDWSGRGVAAFSSAGSGWWQVYRFSVPVRSHVHVNDKPFVMPLVDLLDTYGSYTVALVDQQTIRMFHIHLGEQVGVGQATGEEIQRLKTGGGSGSGRTARGSDLQAAREEAVRGNMRGFADELEAFCRRQGAVSHLLLGGAESTTSQFKGMLSPRLHNCLEGTFNISMQAHDKEVLTQSLAIIQENLAASEAQLVEAVQTRAAKEIGGVVGLQPTLDAIAAGRVQKLVLAEGSLSPEVADDAITQALEYGGEVVLVDEDSPLAETEGIGALLRY
jgi:hypothetical protein